MKKISNDHLVSQLFIQKWRKQGDAEARFLPTPQECAKKYKKNVLMKVISALCAAIALVLILVLLLNHFVLKGTPLVSVGVGIGSILTAVLFKISKPKKLGGLTQRLHWDWKELSKGLSKHKLLYQEDSVDESRFAAIITARFETLVEGIRAAERREDEDEKVKMKKKLKNLHDLCSKLNLKLPRYEDIFGCQTVTVDSSFIKRKEVVRVTLRAR